MITALYYYFTTDSDVHWWVEALTILLDLAIISAVFSISK